MRKNCRREPVDLIVQSHHNLGGRVAETFGGHEMTVAITRGGGAAGRCWHGAGMEGVRLTRRGRLVLVFAMLALGLMLMTMLGGRAESSSGVEQPFATETVVIEPGQTLWDIAADVASDRDPREVVADIVDLNALGDAGSVLAGQSLYLPTY